MRRRVTGRRLASAAAATTAMLCIALPARADVSSATATVQTTGTAGVNSGTFSYTTTSGDGHTLQLTGEFAGFNSGNTLVDVFWCASTASPDALFTAVSSCTLGGATATPLSNDPGDMAVAVGVLITSLGDLPNGLALCGTGSTNFLEADLGPQTLNAADCTPQPTAVPQGPDLATVQADLLAVEQEAGSTVTRYANPCALPDVTHICNIVPAQ